MSSLLHKAISIPITNRCNLSCSGCNQLVDVLPKSKLFDIPLSELSTSIRTLKEHIVDNLWVLPAFPQRNKFIGIYGGEPTLHPAWSKVLDILEQWPTVPFVIFTNGRTFIDDIPAYEHYEQFSYLVGPTRPLITKSYLNLFFRIHRKTPNTQFVQTLNNQGDPNECVESAISTCKILNNLKCEALYQNGRIYPCDVSAAMDNLFEDGTGGFSITEWVNEPELKPMLLPFCSRCAFSKQEAMIDRSIHLPPLISSKNQKDLTDANYN